MIIATNTNSRSNWTFNVWERRYGFDQLWVAFDIEIALHEHFANLVYGFCGVVFEDLLPDLVPNVLLRIELKCGAPHLSSWTNPLRGSSLRGGPKSQRFPKPSLRAPITRAWSCCDLQHLPTLKGVRHDCTSAAHD